jgi:hypothetical protein
MLRISDVQAVFLGDEKAQLLRSYQRRNSAKNEHHTANQL